MRQDILRKNWLFSVFTMSRSMTISIKEKVNLEKSLLDRLDTFERNLLAIFNQIQEVLKANAKLRDENDILSATVLKFAESDAVSRTVKIALSKFSSDFSSVQDYRHSQIERVEKKVLDEMTVYGELFKNIRENVKKMYVASETIPGGRRASVTSGAGGGPPTGEMAVSSFNMNQVDRFEEKKVSDLKRLFLEFTKINLIFHSKSVEMFTKCYKDILDIDEKSDITEFRYTFKILSEDKLMSSSLLSSKKSSSKAHHDDYDDDEEGEDKKYPRRDVSSDEEEERK